MSLPLLKLDWAGHDAAKFAVEHWHYSRCLPAGGLVKVGVWERGRFVGVVIFSKGASPNIATPYALKQTEVCELTRVALTAHETPVSRILSIALRMLKKQCPGIRVVVSFADSEQGHHGGIYQAGGWIFTGTPEATSYIRINGHVFHPKTVGSKYGSGGQAIDWLRANIDPKAERVPKAGKHKYVWPIDAEMRRQVEKLRKPYPKRAGSADGGTPAIHAGGGGSTPTPALEELSHG